MSVGIVGVDGDENASMAETFFNTSADVRRQTKRTNRTRAADKSAYSSSCHGATKSGNKWPCNQECADSWNRHCRKPCQPSDDAADQTAGFSSANRVPF